MIIIAYPTVGFKALYDEDFEQNLLLDSFWMVYIFGVLQVALVMFNHDIILGEAARKLRVQEDSLLGNVAWMNTTVSVLNVLVFSGFSVFAEQDYLRDLEKTGDKDKDEDEDDRDYGPYDEDEEITSL
eukprot:CAMPEP_0170467154 /NCGR_PEP_ID=MMETSP0123-20130129/10832_1 /TAXON_ID=182087 /ORGANISM="Favella ehrenbergii, Strain Fehren 1" /LENGTH=127 /DNA_ID=CAMNT_0010733435 /DNA_START=177 /DNA_END=560 /DNA_ORIENTATION=-